MRMDLRKRLMMGLGIFVAIMAINVKSIAQDTEITDDDLKLYATVMAKIDGMKNEMKVKYNDLIKGEELMKGGRRFKELKSAKGDETKLAEINATPEELEVFNRIQEEYTKMTENFKATYPTIIKEELGASVYNKVKKGLKSDTELKSRYEGIVASLEDEAPAEESGE